jgi:Uma2 family endonuclease
MSAPALSPQKPRRIRKAPASRVVRPLPAPGECACVGLADWNTYQRLDESMAGSGFRVRYFRGFLELMSLSFEHESLSAHIARLVETYCFEHQLDFQTWGSTTQRRDGEAGGEPDESYTFGPGKKEQPELIIEVALSSGGIDKLEFWSAFGAKEVWIWQNNRLHGFARTGEESFEPVMVSRLLPGLSLEHVQQCAVLQPTSLAVKTFREQLAAGAAPREQGAAA